MSLSRRSAAIKVVVLVIFLYAITLYQYYTGTVVSTLLREPPKNIRTLNDLLKSNLKAGAHDILYNKDYFRYTTDPIAKELYRKKVVHKSHYNYFSAERGMALVKQGGFAFHVDSAIGYRLMRHSFDEKELCELQEVVMFAPPNVGVGLAKDSPYREIIAYGIRKMSESGLLSRILSIWDEARPECVRTPDASIFSVSIKEFSTPLIVLLLGVTVSGLMLLGEILLWKWQEKPLVPFAN